MNLSKFLLCSSYLLWAEPPGGSLSLERRFSRATSALCSCSSVSPSGTLPGSEATAGEGAGLRAKVRALGSLEQVVTVSQRSRRDCSLTKAWSRSSERCWSRQNLGRRRDRISSEGKDMEGVVCQSVTRDSVSLRHSLQAVVAGGRGLSEVHPAEPPRRKFT